MANQIGNPTAVEWRQRGKRCTAAAVIVLPCLASPMGDGGSPLNPSHPKGDAFGEGRGPTPDGVELGTTTQAANLPGPPSDTMEPGRATTGSQSATFVWDGSGSGGDPGVGDIWGSTPDPSDPERQYLTWANGRLGLLHWLEEDDGRDLWLSSNGRFYLRPTRGGEDAWRGVRKLRWREVRKFLGRIVFWDPDGSNDDPNAVIPRGCLPPSLEAALPDYAMLGVPAYEPGRLACHQIPLEGLQEYPRVCGDSSIDDGVLMTQAALYLVTHGFVVLSGFDPPEAWNSTTPDTLGGMLRGGAAQLASAIKQQDPSGVGNRGRGRFSLRRTRGCSGDTEEFAGAVLGSAATAFAVRVLEAEDHPACLLCIGGDFCSQAAAWTCQDLHSDYGSAFPGFRYEAHSRWVKRSGPVGSGLFEISTSATPMGPYNGALRIIPRDTYREQGAYMPKPPRFTDNHEPPEYVSSRLFLRPGEFLVRDVTLPHGGTPCVAEDRLRVGVLVSTRTYSEDPVVLDPEGLAPVPAPDRDAARVLLPVSAQVYARAHRDLRSYLAPGKPPRVAGEIWPAFTDVQEEPAFLPAPWVAPTGVVAELIREYFTFAHRCYLRNLGRDAFVEHRAAELQYRERGLMLLLQERG